MRPGSGQRVAPAGWISDASGAVLAAGLSVYGVTVVTGVIGKGDHGGVGAAIGVLAMTLPVAWSRRAPLAAAACLGIAAPLNVVAFGALVRCGPCLPAVFYVAGCLGIAGWDRRAAAGAFFLAGSLATQCCYDPRLGPAVLLLMVVIAAAWFAIGRLIGQHLTKAAVLRRRNVELLERRKEAAALSTMVERERVAGELDATLRDTLIQIEMVSAEACKMLDERDADGSTEVRTALAEVEGMSRDALSRMRIVLQGLRGERQGQLG